MAKIPVEQSALEAHNTHVSCWSPDCSRIFLNVSVVERDHGEYSGNTGATCRSPTSSVWFHTPRTFSALTRQRSSGWVWNHPGTVSYLFSVILPNWEFADFRGSKEFRNATPGAKDDVVSREKPHEITLVNLTNLLPVRHVGFLKKNTNSDNHSEQAKMELHLEGMAPSFPAYTSPKWSRRSTWPT